MDTKYDFGAETGERIVYVRPVAVTGLPAEGKAQGRGLDHLYALHAANGERLALVKDRWMAFALARENDATALSVH
ncbi:DUF1150 family protein [Paenirhodobacter enshiensis]|uniref:DUF1150 family protein n=1 Tax=Paenirhodobacter enshiensis TaxID=1105367 RepID=UPI003FA2E2DC